MRFMFLLLLGCGVSPVGSDLVGDIACGSATCHSGQICVVVTSGEQCDVDYDAGIGQYQVLSETCADVPSACGDTPSCACITCYGECFEVEHRTASCGCI